ncbi:NUDIX hydrolase dihydroneopterin triphosphate pyrophosphohydrolase/hydrolase, putative [Leishmania donovani]|uniref:NUDIX hydrolase dihydroneopterin triphosphate pyrophosphohydrolase/hydrolase, putative n=1 Tax=Leishmania donovani TaxID=5661 RepID=A0A3Q8IL17_LEIDO|nr:NUDIX hydrolase dihydroneopterin triphosphate pyrophosphohydrolase/hydrolase, putative [Leishmania donovani]
MNVPSSPASHEGPAADGSSPPVFPAAPSSAHRKRSSHPHPQNSQQSRRGKTAIPAPSTEHRRASAIADGGSPSEGKKDDGRATSKKVETVKLANEHARLSEREAKMVIARGQDGFAYRRSVQAFFVNESTQFLLCQPARTSKVNFRQTVQGGSEGDESPQETAQRETWEELGLDLEKDATFLCEAHPSAAVSGEHGEEEVFRIEKNEIVSERRKEFRYKRKAWQKLGINGQELYPLLYLLKSENSRHVGTLGSKRGVRTEF